jgi:hypothetical protein
MRRCHINHGNYEKLCVFQGCELTFVRQGLVSCRNVEPIGGQDDNFAKIFANVRLTLSNVASESNQIVSGRSVIEESVRICYSYLLATVHVPNVQVLTNVKSELKYELRVIKRDSFAGFSNLNVSRIGWGEFRFID